MAEALPAPVPHAAPPPAKAHEALLRFQQQRRRLQFIQRNRLSPQEVTDHIAWDFDPGPEYD